MQAIINLRKSSCWVLGFSRYMPDKDALRSVARLTGSAVNAASLPESQARAALLSTYPVDRYLVESSDKKELDSIPSEDLWHIDTMLRPEDEVMQLKLQELLKTTTEELKILTSHLQNINQPSTVFKTDRTPLDEDFNEKVHIEELVTSKFNNTRFVNKPKPSSLKNQIQPNDKSREIKRAATTQTRQRELKPSLFKSPQKKLSKSDIKIVQIIPNEDKSKVIKEQTKVTENSNDYYFKYEPKLASQCGNPLSMHTMPQVNIRGECKIQDIFHIEIMPYEEGILQHQANTATLKMHHEKQVPPYTVANARAIHTEYDIQPKSLRNKSTNRKVTKISVRDSSDTTNSSTETQNLHKPRSVICQKPCDSKLSRQSPIAIKSKKYCTKELKIKERQDTRNKIITKDSERNNLNNAAYLPYSHLTLGGITLTDLEKAMSDIPPHNMPLSPILDQIISSREQNISNISKAISKSEENLLRDVERLKVNLTKTLNDNSIKRFEENIKLKEMEDTKTGKLHISDEEPEYDDDFEDDDIEKSQSQTPKTESEHTTSQMLMKTRNLTLRDNIETHEFIPQVKLKDSGTQCSSINKTTTQTSPKRLTFQPINNVLWPLSSDPYSEVNKAYELEKEIIKKLILEEYGDVINKGTTSASTSTNINKDMNKNTIALQKNTQTSPARVKSVMTSTTKHKTRTTSPVTLNLTVDHETSPHSFLANPIMRETESDVELNESADLALSINLSLPKFSLQLPKTSHDVMNNLNKIKYYTETGSFPNAFKYSVKRNNRMNDTSTTTAEVSSSEISSLGEVKNEPFDHFNSEFISSASIESTASSPLSSSSIQQRIVRERLLKSDGEVTQASSRGEGVLRPDAKNC